MCNPPTDDWSRYLHIAKVHGTLVIASNQALPGESLVRGYSGHTPGCYSCRPKSVLYNLYNSLYYDNKIYEMYIIIITIAIYGEGGSFSLVPSAEVSIYITTLCMCDNLSSVQFICNLY